ncbi:hydrogenase maturation protein [Photobacterium sp. OFAV2-7]|uniref:hydrogenase maturation protein n=1 Tax=Photobacterium sp. OFAV2-7 TaxID=2917748 RepID=UPI001EF551A9|nr:hydrogenase maturation protein [Photobacterium sp. OFAV2-7]MCG7587696.1 hydrogenase maturation protein [Photobacterium sp. OFAV2-7]
MRILLLSTSYNSLTQCAHVELRQLGYEVSVELALNEHVIREAVELFNPDLILCPMLTKIIPGDVWHNHTCIVVHPGIMGDRGHSSLDWAILGEQETWGVTALQAEEQVDAGPIWATYNFPMRKTSKSGIYRDEVRFAAIRAMITAVKRFESGLYIPKPLNYNDKATIGRFRAGLKQVDRYIDWATDSVSDIVRKIDSADGNPGLLDRFCDGEYYLYGAHAESNLTGEPGSIIAQRIGAICRAAVDGAVWISHVKKKPLDTERFFKLPAAIVLREYLQGVPELPLDVFSCKDTQTFKEIWYEENNAVGYLYFDFYNGAMSTEQCQRFTQTFCQIRDRPIKAIVLMGGRNFWSNGINLNTIEAANSPAEESWNNINAINDFVLEVLTTTSQLIFSAMHGNAGAGGVMMALAADKVIVREGVVLNPYYRAMGGLYGSEYWTYSLPKRVGMPKALELTTQCLPLSAEEAKGIGLIDDIIYQDESGSGFREQVGRMVEYIANGPDYEQRLTAKQASRESDEQQKPLAQYRREELEMMKVNFYGEDQSYHIARKNFVYKVCPTATPLHLAVHRKTKESINPLADDIAGNSQNDNKVMPMITDFQETVVRPQRDPRSLRER